MRLLALRGLVRKEVLQIRADRRLIVILVVTPLLQLVISAYAANLDVATARVVIVDRDRTPESRALAGRLAASDSYEFEGYVPDDAGAEAALASGRAEIAFVIPNGYGKDRASGTPTAVQVLADGTDASLAGVGLTAAAGLLQREGVGTVRPLVESRTRVLYNPDLRSRFFLVPGILGIVLMVVTMIASSMGIVREKEAGTLEQLQVTPVSRATILAAKLIPYVVIGFLEGLLILALMRFWFRVPMEGPLAVVLVSVAGFLLCTLGLGLLVSTLSKTQQQAMMTSLFLLMLPMIYLSGFIFAIESMPKVVQPLAGAMPLTYFLVIVRGVMLKGAGMRELWPELAKLWGLGVVIFALAVARFRKRLD